MIVCSLTATGQQPIAAAVGPIGVTVANMDRWLNFILTSSISASFSDEEFPGENIRACEGRIRRVRIRVARLQLGEEQIELTEYLAPKGHPCRLIRAAMIAGFSTSPSSQVTWTGLRLAAPNKVEHASPAHSVCLNGTKTPEASRPFIFAILTNMCLRCCGFLRAKATQVASAGGDLFWASIIRQS